MRVSDNRGALLGVSDNKGLGYIRGSPFGDMFIWVIHGLAQGKQSCFAQTSTPTSLKLAHSAVQ